MNEIDRVSHLIWSKLNEKGAPTSRVEQIEIIKKQLQIFAFQREELGKRRMVNNFKIFLKEIEQ